MIDKNRIKPLAFLIVIFILAKIFFALEVYLMKRAYYEYTLPIFFPVFTTFIKYALTGALLLKYANSLNRDNIGIYFALFLISVLTIVIGALIYNAFIINLVFELKEVLSLLAGITIARLISIRRE